ncbi:MAG TPA: hypothetical protein VNM68_08190 [Candidatus Polarisedimenticolia bacterium]|nr:hypothetical protein [Candidatus Polarisedimenticolia bacterium]
MLEKFWSYNEYGAHIGLATYHACRGEIDAAMEWLEKAAGSRYLVAWNFVGVAPSTLPSGAP